MPFVKVSRDKRGYEYFHLIQPTVSARGRTYQRVLYWFRTPPDVKVGREPFDEGIRRELEAQHPDIVFEWDRLRHTPIPPVPIDWRERRRVEKAARRLQRAEEQPAEVAPEPSPSPDQPGSGEAPLAPSGTSRRRHRRRGRREPFRGDQVVGRPLETASDSATSLEPHTSGSPDAPPEEPQ